MMLSSIFFTCCLLIAVVRSAPINRFHKAWSEEDETKHEPIEDLYKDPTVVLGIDFTPNKMKTMCETNVVKGVVVTKARQTARGIRTCRDVCARYKETVCRDVMIPIDAYCEHGPGAMDAGWTDATCECLFKVQSDDQPAYVEQFSFEVNTAGNIRVSTTRRDVRRVVTERPTSACLTQE